MTWSEDTISGLEALAEMRGSFTGGRPNCIILDEVDGISGNEGQVDNQ